MKKANADSENVLETILQPGQILDGKYRVDHLLGQGGMAAVWAGTNEHTGKRVALKVILLSLASQRAAQDLFHVEALAASRVNHPNVVNIFDVIDHKGMTCIVMEMLDGESLASYIARKRFLSVSEAAMLLLPAMRGVAAANAQGVIHRDLKPQNIFICIGPDGRIVTTKVLDFGISVMVEKRVMDPSAGPALAMGTLAYMSPEHLLGEEIIDCRADVYGFGVLLYESLTGQVPFPGEPGPALIDRVLNKPALPVTILRPDLPLGLVRIIAKAMAKERDQRYSDLNLMVSALEDELMPATATPRLLTPYVGVPSLATTDPGSAPLAPAMQAIPEPSGLHPETRALFALPRKGSNGGLEDLAPPPPTSHGRRVVRALLVKPPFRGSRRLSAPRRWRKFLGASVAVALGFIVVLAAMRGARVQGGEAALVAPATPRKGELVAQSAVPAARATAAVARVATSAPLAIFPSQPAPSAPATRDQPTSRRQTQHGALERNEAARAPSRARRADVSATPTEPRAGRLSEHDF